MIKGVELVPITPKSSFRPHQREYPLEPEAGSGIALIVEN